MVDNTPPNPVRSPATRHRVRLQPVVAFEPVAEDLVGDVLARVIELAPAFTAALAAQVERETREKWGGDRVYIQRRGGTLSQRNAEILRDYRNGERIPFLKRKYGLSEARLWAIIGAPEKV